MNRFNLTKTNTRLPILGVGIVAAFSFMSSPLHAAAEPRAVDAIEYPPLNPLTIPEPERFELDNGLVVFLLPDSELPLVDFAIVNRAGSAYDPQGKAGLAEMTAEVIRTGGTEERSGDEIDEYLESIAARIEFSASRSSASASGSSLVENAPEVLRLFSELLENPALPENKIQLEQLQQASDISRRNDQPMDIAQREFRDLIYGAESPFSSHTEYETIQNITRDDLAGFHKTFYQPQNTVLGIWGDFDAEEMKTLVRETFGDWQNTGEVPALPEKIDAVEPGTYAVTKPDLVQSVIFMGHLGGKRDNPDFFPLQVMNRILSSGFTSRLFVNVRSTKGLAYSVFGAYASFYDYPGIFYAGCLTQNERAVEAVQAITHEINRLKEEKVSEEELQVAKEGFLNSFVFNFDDKGQIIQRMLTYELHGYPLDFLQKTKEEVEKVTREDVLRVAQEYLRPEDLRVLVVGNLEPDDPAFEPLGEVSAVDITIPEPAPADELPAPSTEETDES